MVVKLKANLYYNINVLLTIIKKDYCKILIIFLIFLSFMLLYIFYIPIEISIHSLNLVLGVLFEENFLGILWLVFQIIMTIYLSYLFLFYETNNSPEFIFLRTRRISLLLGRYLTLETVVISFRALLYFALSILFFKNLAFNSISFLLNVFIHLFVSSIPFLFYLFMIKKEG